MSSKKGKRRNLSLILNDTKHLRYLRIKKLILATIVCWAVLSSFYSAHKYFIGNIKSADYLSYVNLLLTIILVTVTIIYAYLTRNIYHEMSESRLANIRPLFSITAANPTIRHSNCEPFSPYFMLQLSIMNVGSGPANHVKIICTFLGKVNGEETAFGTTDRRSSEKPFYPGEMENITVSYLGFDENIDTHVDGFCRIDVPHIDSQGNFYLARQYYNLNVFKSDPKYTLRVTDEFLFWVPFRRRKPQEKFFESYCEHGEANLKMLLHKNYYRS